MLIEHQKRSSRVRFKHPVRVVTLDGQPRVIRTLTANVSHKGMFVRMPEPLPMGTRVALSLEAGGRALALAQAEVVWARAQESHLPGRFAGCGVKFTGFLHPRAEDLVDYLVDNLDRGKPLLLAPPERTAPKWFAAAAAAVLVVLAAGAALVFSDSEVSADDIEDEVEAPVATQPIVAGAPIVVTSPGRGIGVRENPPSTPPPESAAAVDKLAAQGIAADKVAADKVAAEKLAAEKLAADKLAADKLAADKVAADKVAAEKVAADKLAADKLAADKLAADKLAADTLAADTLVADTLAADKVAADKVAADKVAADKVAADKVAADKLAAEKATASKTPKIAADKTSRPEKVAAKPAQNSGDFDDLAASVDPRALKQTGRSGRVSLPSCATSGLSWSLQGTNLVLDPGVSVSRAFLLTNPARAVFDLDGAAPKKTVTLSASGPHMQSVRLGKLPNGTRVVVDLDELPRSAKQADGTLVLSY
ncbi:MAG: histone H1-like repetitive region-containing protein [Archangium sp.]|nr:histone H1-like repetitive region-containing protein [Archangium sp.]